MPFSNSDCAQILDTVRKAVRDAGFEQIDNRLFRPGVEGSGYQAILDYLDGFSVEVALLGSKVHASTLELLNESASTEAGEPITGIRIGFSELESEVVGKLSLLVEPQPEADELADEVRVLRSIIVRGPDQDLSPPSIDFGPSR